MFSSTPANDIITCSQNIAKTAKNIRTIRCCKLQTVNFEFIIIEKRKKCSECWNIEYSRETQLYLKIFKAKARICLWFFNLRAKKIYFRIGCILLLWDIFIHKESLLQINNYIFVHRIFSIQSTSILRPAFLIPIPRHNSASLPNVRARGTVKE